MKTYDYINRVVITLPLSVYEGTWTTLSPLVAMHHMILRVRRKNFEITTKPNRYQLVLGRDWTSIDRGSSGRVMSLKESIGLLSGTSFVDRRTKDLLLGFVVISKKFLRTRKIM